MISGAYHSLNLTTLRFFFVSHNLNSARKRKKKLQWNSGLGRRWDLLKDATDLFIPEIICMVWQPQQQHHPLSMSAKSQAVASWVQNLCEILFLITRENGKRAEKREKRRIV